MTSAVAKPRTAIAPYPGCAECLTRAFGFCDLAGGARPLNGPVPPAQQMRMVAARRTLFRARDVLDSVPIICSGWALSAVMLADGSRQILSFLLPGDFVSAALLFDPQPKCSVEAITDVTYRVFTRTELKDRIFANPQMAETLLNAWIEEKRRADELIIDLGRRPAMERVARLILGLVERLQERGMTAGSAFEVDFPLRQHHIADAVGLTPVHVNKLLTDLRRGGVIKLGERSLAVLDPARLRTVASSR